MSETDLFIYSHTHHHISVPNLRFGYLEQDTGNVWNIAAAVDLIYLLRSGQRLSKRSNEGRRMDADLMVKRLECALLLAKAGFFQFKFTAGCRFTDLEINDSTKVGYSLGRTSAKGSRMVIDWFNTFSKFNCLRRAAEDAHLAFALESEAILFVYRGFEWLKKGLNVSWKDLGKEIDVPQVHINGLKKMANEWDAAARHAVSTGKKVRFGEEYRGGWVYGLLHGVVHARCKLDSAYATRIDKEGDPWPI